ncbi:epoxyqueuosine reductase QueH [uncultured Clostridium sp.]|uniref:epoxyqueuosine reductase QueH n=1 Tax=uncultured Clostridium sp. TaxID=59620 RepID=UPI0025EEE1FB|nr:epoxyqueuosine reductase QueH [uncultured Clostridium sp.]
MKENYNKKMLIEIDKIIDNNKKPTLLLHSCCAPCSSYVIEFLSQYFQIEVFFFNPNIYPENEYIKRLEEQIRLIKEMGFNYKVVENKYESNLFYDSIRGYEKMGEGSKRCEKCFMLRLDKTAQYAKLNKFDYFTTTLTISPLKNAELINSIGEELENKYNVKFLNSDFKKNNGYKTSVELSKKYNLYRQNYCGCVFSQQEYVDRINKKNNI